MSEQNVILEKITAIIRDLFDEYDGPVTMETTANDVAQWEPGLQPAVPDKLSSAVTYVKGWSPGGGTSTKAALQAAYGDADVEAIYLLSDGMPNGSADDIIAAAKGWSNGGGIPCHTIAMVAGGSESTQQKNDALAFMEQLAMSTGGTYRGLGSP